MSGGRCDGKSGIDRASRQGRDAVAGRVDVRSVTTIATESGRASFSASKKYAPEELQKDYQVYRSLLETHHPGLYWYTAKDSMDYFFDWGAGNSGIHSLNHSSGKFSVL